MTLLGILFVLGVAFLASMNFEADMIVSESKRDRAESSIAAVVDQMGSTLRDGLISDSSAPFGNPSAALSPAAYAEMPGVHNTFSPIEPYRDDNGTPVLSDDWIRYRWFTDLEASQRRPFAGPVDPLLEVNTKIPPGFPTPTGDFFVDADGDGVADSLQVDAKVLKFSDAQLAALSARLNPASNPTGRVYVGLRVIPHGGLVNLNASHPKLIENVLDVPDLRFPANPAEYGNFKHRPTQDQVAYSPLLEEPSLRRRGLLAPRAMSPSWLQGDPLMNLAAFPSGQADMQWQLFPPVYPGGAAMGKYETVFNHRYWAFNPSWNLTDPDAEWYNPGLTDLGTLWALRMEPFTAESASPPPVGRTSSLEYDRRHLVTTVSHDDLLARGGRAPNPSVPGGEEDILAKMTQANQTAWIPNDCPVLLPFEYADYPDTIPDGCCPTDLGCRLNARKGRLQLSLPFLDERIDAANAIANPADRQAAFDRIFRLIHDAFFLLVRNAARVTTLEGTPCSSDLDCVYANAVCGPIVPNRPRLCTTRPLPPLPATPVPEFKDCAIDGCRIPGSACRADGVCTIQAPYWRDAKTSAACNAALGEVWDAALSQCLDAWTRQTRSQALVSRTAAALTANFLDYADADEIPTRVPVRSLDLSTGLCLLPVASAGRPCDMDADCGPAGLCSPPRGMCVKGSNTGRTCGSDATCGVGGGAGACRPPAKAAGRPFDFDPAPNITRYEYVYGLERQPYITEVATFSEAPGPPPSNTMISARAVEIFNPHDTDIDATNQYYLYEVDPATGSGVVHPIPLTGFLYANSGLPLRPFTTFVTGSGPAVAQLVSPTPPFGDAPRVLSGADSLGFFNGWILYLVRRYTFPGDATWTEIVVDQFEVKGANIGKEGPGVAEGIFSVQRVVKANSPWTATVPRTVEIGPGPTSLGNWNDAGAPAMHPVEVNFVNLGSFSRPFMNPTNAADPRNGSVSFPTTGSMLMLMRHANRSFSDRIAPDGTMVPELAFTTRLLNQSTVTDALGGTTVTIFEEDRIDNGRMPVFDHPELGADGNWYAAHHLAPFVTQLGAPGNLDMLPWGQLVFDYFTALPLSNPGPYVDLAPGPAVVVAMPESQPRVDMEGLRVHGRININAAPWKVLAGLPFVPMEKIPVPLKARTRRTLGYVVETAADSLNPTPAELTLPDNEAARIGPELAQAIVAYRELRPMPSSTVNLTGNYADGTPSFTPPGVGSTPIYYARGWNSTLPAAPMARRGTGFMSVGELANVRHLGAATITPTPPPGFPITFHRIDMGVLDEISDDNNTENFVDAVAGLVALGDWVTVRSQVFTVYGVLRGDEDASILDPDPFVQQKRRTQDVDSRALRFQETIDRLPTFLGEPMPSRIGNQSLTRYSDVHND